MVATQSASDGGKRRLVGGVGVADVGHDARVGQQRAGRNEQSDRQLHRIDVDVLAPGAWTDVYAYMVQTIGMPLKA